MFRAAVALLIGAAVGFVSAADDKTEIQGGISGKIRSVDVAGKTLTMVTDQGRQRTFTVTGETSMLGPRGGKVRRHLKDPRFREGFPVTVVAQGTNASEVHLGFAKDADDAKTEHASKAGTQQPTTRDASTDQPKPTRRVTKPATQPESSNQATEDQPTPKSVARSRTAKYPPTEEDDDDNEVPGHIKSFDPSRRILVVKLLNGKDRSFMLSRDVKILVRGAASKQGLEDPALKTGAKITVTTDENGRRVKELEIVPASRFRRAG
jgi:hypothetical protein